MTCPREGMGPGLQSHVTCRDSGVWASASGLRTCLLTLGAAAGPPVSVSVRWGQLTLHLLGLLGDAQGAARVL